VSGYRAVSSALRELGYDGRDKIVTLSSSVKTLLDQANDLLQKGSNKTYNEYIEQAIPKFDELLTAFSELIIELVTTPTPTPTPTTCSAGINPVPGLEMGEAEFTVLSDE
jgi:hypothetical protein